MKRALVALAFISLLAPAALPLADFAVSPAAAQSKSDLNRNTFGVMASSPDLRDVAVLIANVVDHEGGLRVLPVNGKGPVQTITDLLYLRGIDAALLPSDAIAYAAKNELHQGLTDKIAYIVKLASLPVVLVARQDIERPADLAGKRLAHGNTGSASFVAAHMMLDGLSSPFVSVAGSEEAALEAVRSGKADAAIFSGLNTAQVLKRVSAKDKLHVLPLQLGESDADAYLPAMLQPKDYPGLVSGEPIETVASALVLAVIKWPPKSPQVPRMKRFSDSLLESLAKSSGRNINLAATAPGIERFAPAQKWLDARKTPADVPKTSRTVLKED
jgi:ABC-type amino acid transport substrate-binding protein